MKVNIKIRQVNIILFETSMAIVAILSKLITQSLKIKYKSMCNSASRFSKVNALLTFHSVALTFDRCEGLVKVVLSHICNHINIVMQ